MKGTDVYYSKLCYTASPIFADKVCNCSTEFNNKLKLYSYAY